MTERRRIVSHPGIYIKDAIEELGLSQSEFALRTGLSIKNVSTLINGESNITFDVAVKLAGFFNNDVEGWINLQTKYNLYSSEEARQKEYEEDWSIAKQFDKGFFSSLLGINIDSKDKEASIDELRKCLNVTSLQNLRNQDLYAFCRTSVIKDLNDKNIVMRNAWITLAEQAAREMTCSQFDKERIISNVDYLKSFTLKHAKHIGSELRPFLASCGVKLVILPYLSGSNISGVTKWISNENCVMVAINDCGKDADKIWFSIFHELGHAIKNHKRHLTISYTRDNVQDEDEIEADEFARNSLLNKNDFDDFVKNGDYSLRAIDRFAAMQGVADFIVIGRLQKESILGWEKYQNRKVKYEIY